MFKLFSPEEFLDDLILKINSAQEQIKIESMLFESGIVLDKLSNSLILAAERGVKIWIIRDWVSQKYVHDQLPLVSIPLGAKSSYAKKLHKKNMESINNLTNVENIFIKEVSRPNILLSLVPFSGRNHMKIYIVDDYAWIGGINISDNSFKKIDFMVRIKSSEIAKEISKTFNLNFENIRYKDFEKVFTDMNLIVDSGKKNKSLIYDRAFESICLANSSIIFMSQFVPDGKILKKLIEKAKGGVSVSVITSKKSSDIFTKYPEKVSYINFVKKTKNISNINLIHLEKNVHAKLIMADKTAIFGSHNFVIPGVLFGTKEIAIWSKSSELILEIEKYIKPYLLFDNE